MPAKICLGFSALMFFLYGLSFMFFGDCYVIGGNGCFSPIDNGVPVGDVAYGAGGPESAFNGALFFGIFIFFIGFDSRISSSTKKLKKCPNAEIFLSTVDRSKPFVFNEAIYFSISKFKFFDEILSILSLVIFKHCLMSRLYDWIVFLLSPFSDARDSKKFSISDALAI